MFAYGSTSITYINQDRSSSWRGDPFFFYASRNSRSGNGSCQDSREGGFTLVEMVVTMALMAVLLSLTAGALSYYFSGRSLDVAAREITSQIREAQAMAVASGNTYRIDFSDGDSYQMKYRQGDEWVDSGNAENLPSSVSFSVSSPPSFDGDAQLDLHARGTAEDGQLVIEGRFGMTRTVRVEAGTANVSVTG